MGWTYTNKFSKESVQDFLQREFWGESGRCEIIASALKNMRTFYAAVRTKETGEVWAMVCLVDLKPYQGFNIGFKDMDETVGPCERDCPERIMKLLTPLPDDYDGSARQWREDCWKNIEKRKSRPKLTDGCVVKFAHPVRFTDGAELDTFTVKKKGRKVLFRSGYGMYRITGYATREYEVLSS